MSVKKPGVAIAHVFAKTFDIKKTTDFYLGVGLRKVFANDGMSILELRGGTHILFFKRAKKFAKAPAANFDLMVDNVRQYRARLKKRGLKVGKIVSHKQSGHELFEAKDPDGRVIYIYSSHTDGRPV